VSLKSRKNVLMPRTPEDVAARGLADAIQRLERWISHGDDRSPVALSDAINHITTLENAAKETAGEDLYYATRNSSSLGQTVAGIIYARRFHIHEAVLAGQDRQRYAPRLARGGTTGRGGTSIGRGNVTLTWRPLDELPPSIAPETWGRDHFYAERVADRPVVATLREAFTFFEQLNR
jgi:hypothetical protein